VNGGTPTGKLTIGADETVCGFKLPDLLKEFNTRYPQVEVSVRIGTACDMEDLIRGNDIDVAIFMDKKTCALDLIVEIEHEEPFAILTSTTHPLAQKKYIEGDDFAKYPLLISQGCSWEELFKKDLEATNASVKLMLYQGSAYTLKQFAINGLGITLLPLYTVTTELKENQLKKLNWQDKEFYLTTQVVHHKNKWVSPALKAFLELCKELKL
jgi:DNA-binding transcriptional LysR family regulator